MDATSTLAEVARLLPERVQDHYGPSDRVDALRRELAAWADDTRDLDPARLAEIEGAAQRVFVHLELTFAGGLTPETRSPGWPDADREAVRRDGAMIRAVERRPDGTAVLRLDGLADAAAAAPLLAGAFALTAGAERIVLDLRRNGGGDPATVMLIIDWLAGDGPRHVFDVRYVDDVRQWWTAGAPLTASPGVEVTALIGPGTYSSGEALAWVLQREQLAMLVGQPTKGAADHVVPLALTRDVRALIPEAAVLAPDGGPAWEGVGVQPDVKASVEGLADVGELLSRLKT